MGPGDPAGIGDDWWRGFFEADYLRLFADAVGDRETERAVNDLVGLVGVEPGWRILDAPGGSGRHAVPLALLGCHVTLVDRSPAALAAARTAAAALDRGDGGHLRVLDVDLADPPPLVATGPHGPPFDLVANLFNSFGYFADAARDRAVVGWLADQVADGGWLVMEVVNREAALAEPIEQLEHVGGAAVHSRREFDPASDRLTIRYRVEADDGGSVHTTGTVQRLWSPDDLHAMVAATGLTEVGRFGDLDGRPAADDEDWVVVVARR